MRLSLKLLILFLILFFPIALLAIFTLPNEYASLALESAVDCDGPITVMIYAIPSYLLYGSSLIIFTLYTFKSKKWGYLSIVVFCGIVVSAITPNVITAITFHEINKTENMTKCQKGW